MNGDSPCPINPLAMHGIYIEGNVESISATILIDSIMEIVFIGVDFSLEEI
jgi:hypothetical protein